MKNKEIQDSKQSLAVIGRLKKELEQKNRELEIEAGLERVRTRAMAMKNSEELADLVAAVFNELVHLGFVLTRCYIYIIDPDSLSLRAWTFNTEIGQLPESYHIKYLDLPYYKALINAWKAKKPKFVYELGGAEKKEVDRVLFNETEYSRLPESVKTGMASVDRVFLSYSYNNFGALQTGGLEPLSDDQMDILYRFGKVFDLTYTRFSDLKQAEAQAREAEIEVALERVRSRSMAMHRSEEIADIAGKIFSELRQLDLALNRVLIWTFNDTEKYTTWWSSNPEVESTAESYRIDYNENPVFINYLKAWQQRKPIYLFTLSGDTKKSWEDHLFKHTEMSRLPMAVKKGMRAEGTLYTISVISDYGLMMSGSFEPLSDANIDIIQRFGRVFQQSYTRYLDVQKAEAQAREAQIEAALEKVRSRSLAMHQAEELGEVATVVFEKLRELDMPVNDGVSIVTHIKDSKDQIEWMESPGHPSALKVYMPYHAHPILDDYWKAKKEGLDFIAPRYDAEESRSFFNYIFEFTDYSHTPEEIKEYCLAAETYSYSAAFQKNSSIFINDFSGRSLSEKEIDIVKRFSKVFEQAYVRFLDLQKAESQAREAQIEAALERVRSRTMGMQHSNELQDTAMLLFQQVEALGVPVFGCGFNIWDDDRREATAWMAGKDRLQPPFKTSSSEDIFLRIYEAAERGESLYMEEQGGEALKDHYEYMKSIPVFKEIADKMATAGQTFPTFQIMHCAFFSHGYLMFISFEPVTSSWDIFKRFAKVFEQTYTRFLDLKKVEMQAREAQIEASLEKIRARAMAMQKSDELREVVGLVSEELNISLENTICIIMNFDWKSKEIEWWSTGFNVDNLPESYKIPIRDAITDHPLIRHYREALQKGISFTVYKLEGEIKRSWDKYIFEQSELKKIPLETQNWMRSYEGVICNEAFMSHGVLEVDGPEQLSDDQAEVLQRFAKVVDLTYMRIEDLQQAEARAVEAVRQASLDRVRGVIASMRTKEDLNRITPLIWMELRALEVPFFRCGVFIMNAENEIIKCYLSDPDGKTLGIFDLPFHSELIGELMVDFWQKKKIYKEHWTQKQFVKFMERLMSSGRLNDPGLFQGAEKPPEKLNLHFIPFKQGMLYVGNDMPLSKDRLALVQSLADAFSIAYARYEDFKQLEDAKNQIEITLDELRSTQTQLIQSEKMASLGELTAGIAHEIQNPLNFVNNFSELNHELLEELKAERAKLKKERDENLEDEIISDVTENQVKINEHGKRASEIVKSMLQHSRSSAGEKELTDVNALCDEYMRLAYHGMRAKDKSFNAEYKLELDPGLPKINIVPQDIGRVLLNLINNAFQAVSSKALASEDHSVTEVHNPRVTLITQHLNNSITIRIVDNGPGIPDEIRDKIFQPFFTTKPTGQGTGLGLSLSYDIIKAHGGEIAMNSEHGSGSELIVILPVSKNESIE